MGKFLPKFSEKRQNCTSLIWYTMKSIPRVQKNNEMPTKRRNCHKVIIEIRPEKFRAISEEISPWIPWNVTICVKLYEIVSVKIYWNSQMLHHFFNSWKYWKQKIFNILKVWKFWKKIYFLKLLHDYKKI